MINTIIQGDAIKILKKMPNNSIDLIFADPPFNRKKDYGVDKDNRENYFLWVDKWIKECFRLLKEEGNIFIMINSKNVGYYQVIMDKYGYLENFIIWCRGGSTTRRKFNPSHQDILFYSKNHKEHYFKFDAEHKPIDKNKNWLCKEKFRRYDLGDRINEVWDDIKYVSAGMYIHKEAILKEGTRRKFHPCQMPLSLIRRIIRFASKEGDIILDPFIGLGTTAVACLELKRKFIGIELNPEYIDMSYKRIANVQQRIF